MKYKKKCPFWWVILEQTYQKKIVSRVRDVRTHNACVRVCMCELLIEFIYITKSKNVKPIHMRAIYTACACMRAR